MPSPVTVDCKPAELIYKFVPKPTMVEVTWANNKDVDTYAAVPNPAIVETNEYELTYPETPRP